MNAAQDAWALDMTKDVPEWSALDLGASPPSGRRNGCGVFEPESQRLFVYGGTKDAKVSETGLFALDLSGASPTFTRIEREGPLRSGRRGSGTSTRRRTTSRVGSATTSPSLRT